MVWLRRNLLSLLHFLSRSRNPQQELVPLYSREQLRRAGRAVFWREVAPRRYRTGSAGSRGRPSELICRESLTLGHPRGIGAIVHTSGGRIRSERPCRDAVSCSLVQLRRSPLPCRP